MIHDTIMADYQNKRTVHQTFCETHNYLQIINVNAYKYNA